MSENDLVRLLCVPSRYHGFALLLTSLNAATKDEDLLNPLVKKLYPLVAKQHGTTVGHVISSIRNFIKVWWLCGNRSFLPNYITSASKPPGNKAFLYAIIAYLQRAEVPNK